MDQKTFNEIVQNMINNIHNALPEADTKEGTFIRDVFINPISDEIAGAYGDMKLLEISQSLLTASNEKLDKLASNYFITRKQATHSFGKVRFYIAGTDRLDLSDEELPNEILIPQGTIISTLATYSNDSLEFKTTETILLNKEKIKLLPIDSGTGLRFIEIGAMSVKPGTINNISAGEITQQITNLSEHIELVTNPFMFSGGTERENDSSLKLRVNLAITGSNIGTRDGYLSYILKQGGIIDAKVIAAGESFMFRDGGYIDYNDNYQIGSGGMVDIYIRGQLNSEEEWVKIIDNEYVYGTEPYKDIILPKQPVNNIVSITAENDGNITIFKNADEYEVEQSTTIGSDGKPQIEHAYYKDILWDFSIKDNFPDIMHYSLPDLNPVEIEELKLAVDRELQEALIYLENVNYGLEWSLMEKRQVADGQTELFDKYFYSDNKVYKIVAHDSRLDGRTFIKKNDKIYIRVYDRPDYRLIKDIIPKDGNNSSDFHQGNYANSVLAKDRIQWLRNKDGTLQNVPKVEDTVTIQYNFDQLVNDMQEGIEKNKILTADVLVKQAQKLPVEIIIDAICHPSYDPLSVKRMITNRVIVYINTIKKLGDSFDRSDIIAIARQTEGVANPKRQKLREVEAINVENVTISILGKSPQRKIEANENEYFQIENIMVNVRSTDRIIT